MVNPKNQDNFKRGGYPFNVVGLGGTFDHLHDGHKKLVETAFKFGRKVAIALTTNELLEGKDHCEKIEPFDRRKQNLSSFIENELDIQESDYEIIPLSDPFGPAITDKSLEAHISSMETYHVSLKINEKRIEKGLKPLYLIIIPMILDDTGQRYSSTSIRKCLKENK